MKTRLLTVCVLVLGLALLLAWGVAAQGPEPPLHPRYDGPSRSPPGWDSDEPFPYPTAPGGGASGQGIGAAVALGQPGLSFRYVETFGETEVAYFADTAHIYNPEGVGVDGAGNLWVAETLGGRALKYSWDGVFLMSIGTAGSTWIVDETHFGDPSDIVVDGDGNIWVADRLFARVVKYDSGGSYLMHLGVSDQSGSDNDHFDAPIGVALDSQGNIYVSDELNHRVQVFDSGGVYSTTIGVTGVSGSDNDHFQNPYRIAIDADDRLYVADRDNHRVQIFDASHTYTATLGITGECGDASDNDRFCTPRGVAVDASRIYVADSDNNRVQVFDRATFSYQTTLGGWGSGDYEFSWPGDVAVDSLGNLYVADTLNHRAQRFNGSLAYVRTFGTTGVPYITDGYHYYLPEDIAIDPDGNIGILEDTGGRGQRLIKLNASGVPQFTIGEAGIWGDDTAHFNSPRAVDFDAQGNIYIADCWNHRIQIFDDQGVYQDTLGTGWGTGNDQFDCPSGVKVDPSGNIIVADAGNRRVQVFDSNHNYLATLGVTGEAGSDDEHFEWPTAVDVDASGNIFVADFSNFRIQKCSWSTGGYACTTFAGETGAFERDFSHLAPMDVALDIAGHVYVADQWNDRVQVFDQSGAYLTTIGGNWGIETGRMRLPTGVAVDLWGNVFVADTVNHRIQKFASGVPGWTQVNINGFGDRYHVMISALEEFKGMLYAGTRNWEAGGQIYRTSDGVNWSAVTEPGFGSPYTNTNQAIIDLAVFDTQLYAGVGWGGAPGQVWRSPDGTNWQPMTTSGFGDANNQSITAFAVFSNTLYAATGNDVDGLQIWRSETGDSLSWTNVVTDGFGYSTNRHVTGFAEFNGALYAAVESNLTLDPAQVWRTTDGIAWMPVTTNGFGNPNSFSSGGFAVFGGSLYLGANDLTAGAQLRRTLDGVVWTPVTDDGFGDSSNVKIESLCVFAGQLYAVTNNQETGIEVWRSTDGINWDQVNVDGFGDSNNVATLWSNSSVVFDDRLFIGTWNGANGGEVWKMLHQVYLPLVVRGYR